MYRNINSHFAEIPRVEKPRSKFHRPTSVKFSGNVSEIIPFYIDPVLPGDSVQLKTSLVARLQTLVAPIMDNMWLDTFYFYCPSRILWSHWKEFMGENTESKWIPQTSYSVPQIEAPSGGWNVGTIADYLGIPTGVDNISVDALPFRMYAMICNEFFRDQNNTDYLDIPFGDATVTGVNTDTFVTDVAKGGMPFKAAKYHDYFTSCLPSPQKGGDVMISPAGNLPVVTSSTLNDFSAYDGGLSFYLKDGSVFSDGTTRNIGMVSIANGSDGFLAKSGSATTQYNDDGIIYPANLTAINTGNAGMTINQLRVAFATQQMLELDARGGTRYREMLLSHFGVHSPDARQNVPEYLGGSHIPININQVVQTSGEVGNTPQGNVAGYSVTSDVSGEFIKSFTEHGYIMGLCVLRYDHTYQQGLERFWSKRNRTDFYMPVFANLGEQKVLNKEIFAQGNAVDDEIFGYQEAWAEYRYKPSRVAGEMRSTYAQSLDVWHLGDHYSSLPVLQSDWIFEDKNNVDRCLQVSSSVSDQFWADFYIDADYTRVMPMYSIPGLKTL